MINKTFGSSGVIFKEKLVVEGCKICANQVIYSLQSTEFLNPYRRNTNENKTIGLPQTEASSRGSLADVMAPKEMVNPKATHHLR